MVVNKRLIFAGLGFAVFASSPLAAKEAGAPPIRLAQPEAAVIDGAGAVKLTVRQGDPAFARIGNPRAVVLDGDREKRRVRVSGFGQEALWIACRDLADTPGYCDRAEEDRHIAQEAAAAAEQQRASPTRGFSFRRAGDGGAVPAAAPVTTPGRARLGAARGAPSGGGPEERGVPVCPGDPRCP